MRNPFMEEFLEDNVLVLNNLPHRVKFNKYVRVASDVIFEEIAGIVEDCAAELDGPFASLASDFYRDRFRREDYGALTVNLTAKLYRLRKKDRLVFMSSKTLNRLSNQQKSKFHNKSAITDKLMPTGRNVANLLVDFVKFDKSKIAINTRVWIALLTVELFLLVVLTMN
jgi:hypothetical protein